MKRFTAFALTVCLLMLCGCGFGVNFWEDGDFSFNDAQGQAAATADGETFYILLGEDQHTYRGLKLGDPAKKSLEYYRLTDFEYEICRNGHVDEEADPAWHQAAPTAEELIGHLSELADERLEVYLYCDVFATEDGYKTRSKLDGMRDVTLAYSFSVRVARQKITEAAIEYNMGQLDEYLIGG